MSRLILAIDTATPAVTAGVVRLGDDVELLAEQVTVDPRAHAERLTPNIVAALDGAGRWRILWSVVYPMMRPTLSVLMVFFFVWTWNEFFIPLVLLGDQSVQTLPIALATLQGQNNINITVLNAGSLLSLLPTLSFFFIFQRTLSRGLTVGSVK